MATVKINCPQCLGQGLVGDPVITRCPQCTGTGLISQDDTQMLAALNSSITGPTNVKIVMATPTALSNSVAALIHRGKN